MHVKPFKAFYPDSNIFKDILGYTKVVRNEYQTLKDKNLFNSLEEECFILYRITSSIQVSDGLICLTSINDYDDGNILRHEKTLEEKELDQIKLYSIRKAMVKPVLLTYPQHEWFDDYLDTLKTDANLFQRVTLKDKQEVHEFWKISAVKDILSITHFFLTDLKRVYVADGHHRLSTFSKFKADPNIMVGPDLMTIYMPFNSLRIYAFNRIVQLDAKWDFDKTLAELQEFCFIEKIKRALLPKFKYNFLYVTDKEMYSCVWRPSLLDKYKEEPMLLDSALINAVLFKKLFKVRDVRTDQRITYVEGNKGWDGFKKTMKKNPYQIGFYLYPVDFEDFKKVSELSLTLPPKSTWFEPRIRNGLIIQHLDDFYIANEN